jgi:DNA-3-methyladenine glycosylase
VTALPPEFYDRPVLDVAPDLLGCTLHHGDASGVIVETEAYHESEPSCHAFGGQRPSTAVLFEAPGNAYVYRSYGIHALVNAVCERPGVGAAVLIRALTPLTGADAMSVRRQRPRAELTNGPGKLTQALAIDLSLNGSSLSTGPIQIRARTGPPPVIVTGPRIGITKAVDLPWRFAISGCPDVSRPRPR